MTMCRSRLTILLGVLVVVSSGGAGCRAKETTASRSAAAYDEAQRTGKPVEKGGQHGGHGAQTGGKPAAAPPADPHAAHGAAAETSGAESRGQKAAMAGMDHSRMSGAASKQPAATGMDHSRMAGMDHARMTGAGTGKQPATGMDHSRMAGMQQPKGGATDHAAMGHGAPLPPPAPEPAAASAQPGQPAATLQADDIDAPAATSLRDAERSAAMAKEMAGGHGMQHGTPYRQLDAGRDSESGPTHEHGAPPPQPTAPADPRASHAAPAPRPSASKPQPKPTVDPHAMHRAPAPRPSPSPTPKPSPHRHEGS